MEEIELPVDYNSLDWRKRIAVREQYVKLQNNLCYHCKCDLDKHVPHWIMVKRIDWSLFPPNFLKHPIHLQHNHETGMTEGAVHAYCNAVMWQYLGK